MLINIYTDGSCRNNGSKDAIGAWGYVALTHDQTSIIYADCARCMGTTNQRMELEAVVQACVKVSPEHLGPFDEIHIYTDSAYLNNCHKLRWYEGWRANGWKNSKKQPVANRDLWEKLIPIFEDSRYYFHKVSGHQGLYWNEYVDTMVQSKSLGE